MFWNVHDADNLLLMNNLIFWMSIIIDFLIQVAELRGYFWFLGIQINDWNRFDNKNLNFVYPLVL